AIDASQAATNGLAEKTARRVAADSVREAIEHLGDERGPAAEKKNKAELHRELRGHVAELLAADVFRHQFTDIVLETALPRLRDELTEEMLSHMREHSLEDTRRVAQEVSWDTAAKAARDATSEQIAVSLTEYQMQANDRVRHLIQASAAELRRSLSICAGIGLALIIAGVIASVYLSTHGISF
ncbi:MAG TPA: hypothetical protein VFL97_05880, partial [Nitrococcus sp.]|nr:hypothetical protein [Nitrococcus sp.]